MRVGRLQSSCAAIWNRRATCRRRGLSSSRRHSLSPSRRRSRPPGHDPLQPAVRLRAAEALLRHVLALRQHLTVEERLEALEMRITEVVIGDKTPPEFDTEEVT